MLALARTHFSRLAFLAGAGSLAAAASFGSITTHASTADQPLTADTWAKLKLIEKRQLTGGDRPTYFFRFQLPKNQDPMPVASCLLTRAPIGKQKEDGSHAFVLRPYTPLHSPDQTGHLDFAIKVKLPQCS